MSIEETRQGAETDMATGLLDGLAAADGGSHPHLDPINHATFTADHDLAAQKASALLAYQRFLADARTVKAKRGGAPASFERNVLAQARQAREDLDAFTGSALRMVGQLNQTNLWNDTISRGTQALGQTGPTSLQAAWSQVTGSEEKRTALAAHGLSAEMLAAITETITSVGVTASTAGGQLILETQISGESASQRATLSAHPGTPADLSELLTPSQFDAVASALTTDVPTYLEAVPSTGAAAYQPPDLFALGLVVARQRMHEHVRKLEDGGLATYDGHDPASIALGCLIAGIFLGLTGSIILELCESTGQVLQPDWVCIMGAAMVVIAFMLLYFVLVVGGLGVVTGVTVIGGVAFGLLLQEVVRHFDKFFPTFDPGQVPT